MKGTVLSSFSALLLGLLLAFPVLTPTPPYQFQTATLLSMKPAVDPLAAGVISRQVFDVADPVCVLVQLSEVLASHRYRAVAYHDGVEQWRRQSEWRVVDGFGQPVSRWSFCEENEILPGRWRFDIFVDAGFGFEFVTTQSAEVRTARQYELVDAATCSGDDSSSYGVACAGNGSRFLADEPVRLWATLRGVVSDHRFLVKTYRNGAVVSRQQSAWSKARPYPGLANLEAVELDTLPGNYRFEFFIDTGRGFERVGGRDFLVEVRSPVDGPVRLQCDWPEEEYAWAFCQHRGKRRHASSGVAEADDGRAWDINLRNYADRGRPVFPVAPGRVVKYGDAYLPGTGKSGGVLIEHQTPSGVRWWSGYLHLKRGSVTVQEGQEVNPDTELGRIGSTGADNSHLHLAVYEGENSTGGLRSITTRFRPRYGTCVAATDSSGGPG